MPTEGSLASASIFLSPALKIEPFSIEDVDASAVADLPVGEHLPDYEQHLHQIDNSWRAGGTHLSRSHSGLWYMRFKVPEAIRAAYPDLPKELRRSTKTRHKIHALAISRKMCLDFLIRHRISETRMGQPDQSRQEQAQTLQPQYSFTVVNGTVQLHFSGSPALETLQEATRCLQALNRPAFPR